MPHGDQRWPARQRTARPALCRLEAAAFALDEASLSEVIESELGYHLIGCEAIHPERLLSFAEARQSIREYLEQQQQSLCQKAWIKALRQQAAKGSSTNKHKQ
ncbi:MAG: hypothetical protein IPK02_11165 [Candidatus Accumulibacter sp.]|uniref:Peptidylprolyl isomerase n=1 Tax=Candidatus Accumulibacter affinis TaxID=2954384 RepID=A0A935T7L2_9PROT|nr:hypothetical protein [Candidatus Accumulibacter affinis]